MATRAAGPELLPPVVQPRSQGFWTGPVALVKDKGDMEKFSQVAEPAIVAPDWRRRWTTMASMVGMCGLEDPVMSSGKVPPVSGTPARETLSLSAMVRPVNRVSTGSGDLISV